MDKLIAGAEIDWRASGDCSPDVASLVRDYRWELLPDQNLERTVLPFSRPRDRLKVEFGQR